MKALATLLERLDALSPKERVLVTVAILLVAAFAWLSLVLDPLALERRRLEADIAQREQVLTSLEAQAESIRARGSRDLDAPNRARRERLRKDIAAADTEIAALAANLIAPGQMAAVLESVLRSTAGLEVVEVRGLGATVLVDAAEAAEPPASDKGKGTADAGEKPAAVPRAWKHGVRLTFRGGYMDALAYLRALEQLPWRFLWEAFELEVGQYPAATTSLVVYTLSLDRRWIGV